MQSEVKSQDNVQGMKDSGQSHRMSIATTIGATIGLIGLILLLYGLFGNANYTQSGGAMPALCYTSSRAIVGQAPRGL